VRYHPAHALLLNVQKDHDEPEAIRRQAATFLANVRTRAALGDQADLPELDPGALVFGFTDRAEFRGTHLDLTATGSRFRVGDVRVRVPQAGRHSAENALAALAGASLLDIPLESAAAALARFRGISRRFEILGERGGIRVVDDFAHNPVKIAAAIAAARLAAGRILAFWQPHGFAPARFFREDLARVLQEALGPADRFYLAEILYLGGTVTRDISSADLAREIAARGILVESGPRERMRDRIATAARPGDTVLVMGARDPTLGAFARSVLECLPDTGAAS
jgi:UDP-N-acetylmuramate--alanine ligase